MRPEKITIRIVTENNGEFENEFNSNQKLKVVVNQAKAQLKIDEAERQLKFSKDGKAITNLDQTIEEAGIKDGETFYFFKEAKKPERDKGFA